MKIIIVGAGLGGLTAAFCFARRGHDVILLERRHSLTPQGGGILIRACATRILHSWSLQDGLAAIGDQTPTSLLRNLETGQIAQRSILVDVSEFPEWGTSRQAMIQFMHEAAVKVGARIQFDSPVGDVKDYPDRAEAILEDGTVLQGEILLAADGIHSRIRSKVLSDLKIPTKPVVSNSTLYGIQVPVDKLLLNPNTGTLAESPNDSINVWIGRKGYVVGKYSKQRGMWAANFGIKAESNTGKGLWDEHGDINHVRASFVDACAPLTAVLAIAEKCDRWKLAEMPDLPRWTSPVGRIVLLGDSAHAMHPNAAQGYSQIVEDIGVLEFLINNFPNPAQNIPTITNDWQTLRKPRVERIKNYAKWNTQLYEGELVTPRHGDTQRRVKSLKPRMPTGMLPSIARRS